MKILKRKKYSALSFVLKYSFVFIIAFSILFPLIAINAADPAGVVVKTQINNPLGEGNLEDIPSFISKIIEIALTVGVPIITLFIIYSGFLFVKAQGNEKELTTAKETLLYTLVGAALLLGAFVISKAIKGTVDEIRIGA